MKRPTKLTSIAGITGLLIATAVWAQPSYPGPQMQGMQNGQQMQPDQKNQTMQNYHKQMQSMMDSNAHITKDIEAAKQSNDPAKMRAALDEAEKALSPMNEHMKSCMNMMKMMQNMHGKSGMMGSGNMGSGNMGGQGTQP